MATKTPLEIFQKASQSLRIDVVTTDGGTTPQTMTGWTLEFVIRRIPDDALVCQLTPTIGNGSGTDDRATVAVGVTDITHPPGRNYEWALWRVDGSNDVPLAYGPCVILKAASQ